MMNKYDEILQIFASQKDEISVMSTKISELERTNMFLMQFIEKRNHLPAVCEVSAMQRYKELAMDKELTINTAREKLHTDATICETSLNTSFEVPDESECRNSFHLSSVISDDDVPHVMSPTKPRCFGLSRSDDVTYEATEKIPLEAVSRSSNLQLKISHLSPSRRQNGTSRNILNYTGNNSTPLVSRERSISSDEKKNTIIARSVPQLVETSNEISSSINSDRIGMILKTASTNMSEPSIMIPTPEIVVTTDEDDKLKQALNYLITTLEQRKSRRRETCVQALKEQLKKFSGEETIEHLLNNKDAIFNDLDDKHTQMQLLLTSQQLKADLFHKTLDSNNQKIIDAGCKIVQQNSSNRSQMSKSLIRSEDVTSEISSQYFPQFSEIKHRRQMELSRLNNNARDQALSDPRVQTGFTKFTALIKGYIVRTLLETEKVRSIIITIKDTAQMALSIRQERLSGDCAQPGDCVIYNNHNRRNHQEAITFQHRLVSQLRHALNELHEIFFTWTPLCRMNLLRNHINQIIRSTTKEQLFDTSDGQGTSSISVYKMKKPAQLSSATVKRRQKLALRRSEGNFKSAISSNKNNGTKNSSSSLSQRKPIYTSPYGCRGYAVGSHSRNATGQSKNVLDRKSRPNNISNRRGTFGKSTESGINKASENIKSVTSTGLNNYCEQSEHNATETISIASTKDIRLESRQQQQQQWVPPKTVTTSICSQAAGDGYPYKSGFVTAVFGKQNCFIDVDEDSLDSVVVSNVPRQSSRLPNNFAEIQANTNNADWRSKTYNFTNSRTNKQNNGRHNILDENSNKINGFNFGDSFSKVEVDIDNEDYSDFYRNSSPMERYQKQSTYTEDPTDNGTTVLVDLSQKSTGSESTNNELKSTFNSNTNHCINKPVVTANNTKYTKTKSKPLNIAMTHLTKPLSVSNNPIVADFDISAANIVSGRTFKIRKRIVACNKSIYSSVGSHS